MAIAKKWPVRKTPAKAPMVPKRAKPVAKAKPK